MKLFTKIIIIILSSATLSFVAISFFTYTSTKSALETTIIEKQNELGRQTMDKIDRLLFNYYLNIQNISEEESIERTLSGAVNDLRVIERRIKELPFLTGPWDVLQVIDSRGFVVVSNTRKKVGVSVPEEHSDDLIALKEALNGHVYYSNLVISKDTGKPTIIFASPIRDQEKPDQPIIGAVIGQIAWPVVTEIIKDFDSSTEFELYTHDGLLIATNQENKESLFTKNDAIALDIEKYYSTTTIGADLSRDIGHKFGESEVLIVRNQSTGYLAYEGNGWVLFIETPAAIIFAPAVSAALRILLILFPIIFLAVFFVLVLLNKFIISPIFDFTKVTDLIAKGDFTKRVEVKSKDEIGQLGISFNTMTGKLQELYKNLDNKVKEKTSQLSDKVNEIEKSKSAILNLLEDTEEAKRHIAKEKDKMDTILHSIGDGVFVMDKNLKIILINKVAAKMAGYEMEEILGTKYSDKMKFISEDTGEVNDQFINKAIETKTVQEMSNHTILVDKNGNKTQVADSIAPLLDKEGMVIGCVMVFRDITKEREIDKAKTEFVSLASHQLRTPLSSISWNAEMLLAGDAGKLTDEQRKYLDDIYEGNQRMVELINSLLNLSRLEMGTFVVLPEPTDVVALAQSVILEQKPQINDKGLVMKTQFSPDTPLLTIDSKLLRMVFQNLVSNAVKYTDKGDTISFTILHDKENLAIEVSDNGWGIPKDQQDRIFTKLFRADNSGKHYTEGTGLGLYIVKLMVEHSGGAIHFQSEENKGTTFFITFPLEAVAQKKDLV